MPLTHSQLENPGDLFANVAKTILTSDSPAFPLPVFQHRQTTQENINRVTITALDLGRASDHMDLANISNVQVPFYNHKRIRLAFTTITGTRDRANVSNHAYCVGRIGYLCGKYAQKFTPAACSGLVVMDIEDNGVSPPEPDAKTDTDRTTRNFEVEYIIPAAIYAAAT